MVRDIPLSSMERVMHEVGVDRVSEEAKFALREALQDELKEITRKAHQYSKHAGRSTILREDIKLASK